MEQVSVATKKLAEGAEKAGNALKPLSTAAAGALTGLVGTAIVAGNSAKEIDKLAKTAGVSAQEIQKLSYASEFVGVELSTLTGSMNEITKSMVSAQSGTGEVADAYKTLKINIKNADGSLRSSNDVFYEALTALSKVKNETQRNALAMKLFGESATQLNPIILDGGEALKQLGKEAEAAGLILSQEALEDIGEFTKEMDTLKAQTKGTAQLLGVEVGKALIPVLESLNKVLADVLTWVKNVDQDTIRFVLTILALVAGLAPLILTIAKVVNAIGTLSSALSYAVANPMVLIVIAAVAIAAALVELERKTQVFSKAFKSIWSGIKDTVKGVTDFISSIFTEKIPKAVETLKGFLEKAFEAIATVIKAPFNLVISAINWGIEKINSVFSWFNNLKWPDFLGGASLGFNFAPISQLPLLAKGGVVSSGSAIVGEAGAELLTMMGGKAVVQPLTNAAKSSVPIGAGETYITNNITLNAGNLSEVQQLIEILNGERTSMRMGLVRG